MTTHQMQLALLDDWRSRAAFVPLLAAVIAPMSTLLDIPALTESWFLQQGERLPDPRINLALSAVSLVLNFAANALLVLRFSVGNRLWKRAIGTSLICWIVKLTIAVVNLIVFGFLTRNSPGISYGEGFWSSVVSLFIVFVIVGLLLFHYVVVFRYRHRNKEPDSIEVQVGIAGRHFMLQNTVFVSTVAVLALFMSRLEGWSYVEGIYFSAVTFLTIGFGDFSPTRTVTQIVLFPFTIFGIVQVALLIEMIVTFVSSRERTRRARRRAAYERMRQEDMDRRDGDTNLAKEMKFLHEMNESAYKLKIMRDLALNMSGFVLFWVLGAIIFSQIENWTYGQGMYFGYVFFLSIGYGDYAPITPAGRVIFILYSMIAVPIMATFAVQTIQSILRRVSLSRLRQRREEFGLEAEIEEGEPEPEKVRASGDMEKEEETTAGPDRATEGNTGSARSSDDHSSDTSSESSVELPSEIRMRLSKGIGKWKTSHSENVALGHHKIRKLLKRGQTPESIEKAEQYEDRVLTEYVLEQAVELERRARRLLLASMKEGTNGHVLLKADRIVQLRNIKSLASKEKEMQEKMEKAKEKNRCHSQSRSDNTHANSNASTSAAGAGLREGEKNINTLTRQYLEEEAEISFSCMLEENEMLREISMYREAFANLLAAGSRLMKLKNEEQYMFERRLKALEEEGGMIS